MPRTTRNSRGIIVGVALRGHPIHQQKFFCCKIGWPRRATPTMILVAVLVSLACVDVRASVPSRVTISVEVSGALRVEAELSIPQRSWSFRNAYAGVLGIAERVEDVRGVQDSGQDAG